MGSSSAGKPESEKRRLMVTGSIETANEKAMGSDSPLAPFPPRSLLRFLACSSMPPSLSQIALPHVRFSSLLHIIGRRSCSPLIALEARAEVARYIRYLYKRVAAHSRAMKSFTMSTSSFVLLYLRCITRFS